MLLSRANIAIDTDTNGTTGSKRSDYRRMAGSSCKLWPDWVILAHQSRIIRTDKGALRQDNEKRKQIV